MKAIKCDRCGCMVTERDGFALVQVDLQNENTLTVSNHCELCRACAGTVIAAIEDRKPKRQAQKARAA